MNEFNNNQNFENQENQQQSNIYRPEPIILDQPPINVVHSTTENDIDAVFSNGNPSPFMPSPKPPRRFSFLTVIISVALAFTVSVIGSFLVFSFLNKNQNDIVGAVQCGVTCFVLKHGIKGDAFTMGKDSILLFNNNFSKDVVR